MKFKTFQHILKHELFLKRDQYASYLLGLIVLLSFHLFRHFYNVPNFITTTVIACAAILPAVLLNDNFIIPAGAKGAVKFQSNGYSWGYILTTVRQRKLYLYAVGAELIIDIILCILMVAINYKIMKPTLLLTAFMWLPLCLYLIRISKFQTVNNSKGRSTSSDFNSKKKSNFVFILSIVAGMIGFGVLNSWGISFDVSFYIILPLSVCVLIYLPFNTYNVLNCDLNKEERKKLNRKYLFALTIIIAIGGVHYYIAEINSRNRIFTDIEEGRLKDVKRTIQKDTSILSIRYGKNGYTPLIWAAKNEQNDIVKVILENGGNVNDLDNIGNNLLTFTASHCDYELSEYLVHKGINVAQMPQDNMNALFTAASYDCLTLVKYFKKIGMEENKLNKDGQNYIQYGMARNPNFKKHYEFIIRNNL